MNLFSHERGKHLPDVMESGMSLGKSVLENRATLHQLQQSSWQKTSPEFKEHVRYNLSPYLTKEQKNKHFK